MQPRIKNFRQHIIFKNIAGVLIFCTFLLSITPRLTLHSLAAHHKDQASKKITDRDRLQFNESGYNCDCNSIVATSPFTPGSFKPQLNKQEYISSYYKDLIVGLSSHNHFYLELRGPPSFS